MLGFMKDRAAHSLSFPHVENLCDLHLDLGRRAKHCKKLSGLQQQSFLISVSRPGAVISYLDSFALMEIFLYMHSSTGLSVKGVLGFRPFQLLHFQILKQQLC